MDQRRLNMYFCLDKGSWEPFESIERTVYVPRIGELVVIGGTKPVFYRVKDISFIVAPNNTDADLVLVLVAQVEKKDYDKQRQGNFS